MRGLMMLPLLVFFACASTGVTPARPATETIAVAGPGGGRLVVDSRTDVNVSKVQFSIEQVWRVLPAAFDSLAVPITHVDPASHILGNDGFKLRQRLGKVSLSRFMDCGTTQIGANADSYDVSLMVLTQVQPAAAGSTTVATTFEAYARPISFSQAWSKCSSRGFFESRLVDYVRTQLQR